MRNLPSGLLTLAAAMGGMLVVWNLRDEHWAQAVLWAGVAGLNLIGALRLCEDDK